MKVFKSKIDAWLICVMVGAMLPAVYVLMSGPMTIGIICTVVALLTFWFVGSLVFDISYIITGRLLIIKTGWLIYAKIPIEMITRIKPTHSILAAPAASLKRIKLCYRDNSEIIVSPRDTQGFIDALQCINPTIVVEK